MQYDEAMCEYIRKTLYKILGGDNKDKCVRAFIDTDDNHYDGILNKDTLLYDCRFVILDNPKTKHSGTLALKEAFIKTPTINSFTYIIIDLNTDK